MRQIAAVFEEYRVAGRVQLTIYELRQRGVSFRAVEEAVRSGNLRKGAAGYWLPTPPDPGFMSVVGKIVER